MPSAPEALDAVRATLPAWFAIAPLLLVPLAALLAWLGAFLGVSVGLLAMRRTPADAHWTERARRGWPARVVATGSPITLALAMGVLAGLGLGHLSFVPAPVLAILVGVATFAGAWSQIRRTERIVKRTVRPLRVMLGGQLFVFLTMIPHLVVVLVAAALMPEDPLAALIASALVLAALVLVALGAGLRLAVWVGLAWPADERLARIVETCSARVGVRARHVWVVRWPMVNALAFVRTGDLAFTEEAVAQLTDAELEAVTAHELGHLGEPTSVVMMRSLGLVALFPIALIRPVAAAIEDDPLFEIGAVWLLVLVALVIGRVVQRVARRMEERADAVAHEHEDDPGRYARALERIYELNLAPAVSAQKRAVHPHLYDRLVTSGATPGYPRPAPPPRLPQTIGLLVALMVPCSGIGAFHVLATVASDGQPSLAVAMRGGTTDDLAQIALARWNAGDLAGALPVYEALAALDPTEPYWASEASRLDAALGRCDDARAAFDEAERRTHARGDDPAALLTAWSEISICVPNE